MYKNIKNIISNIKGFTLIELMVVVAIIVILVLIWGFSGKGHIRLAKIMEARAMVENIVSEEKKFYSANGSYVETGGNFVEKLDKLGVDFSSNEYYKSFKIKLEKSKVADDGFISNMLYIELKTNTTDDDLKNVGIVAIYDSRTDKIEYDEDFNKTS